MAPLHLKAHTIMVAVSLQRQQLVSVVQMASVRQDGAAPDGGTGVATEMATMDALEEAMRALDQLRTMSVDTIEGVQDEQGRQNTPVTGWAPWIASSLREHVATAAQCESSSSEATSTDEQQSHQPVRMSLVRPMYLYHAHRH
jgi:hypothetical protein